MAQTLPFFVARRTVSARCNFTRLRRGALGWLMDGKGQRDEGFTSPFLTFDFHFGVMKLKCFFLFLGGIKLDANLSSILRDFQPSWCISTEGFISKFPVVGC